MGQKDYTKGNAMLAQYMGAVLLGEYFGSKGGYSDTQLLDLGTETAKKSGGGFPENNRYWSDTQLKYHKSWDWLSPVTNFALKKCSDNNDDNNLSYNRLLETLTGCYPNDLESLWDVLVELAEESNGLL